MNAITLDGSTLDKGRIKVSFKLGKSSRKLSFACPIFELNTPIAIADNLMHARFEEGLIFIDENVTHFSYEIVFFFDECLGSAVAADLVYPFRNNEEFFVGAGAFPVPQQGGQTRIDYLNFPGDFKIVDTFTDGFANDEQMAQFFIYGKRSLESTEANIGSPQEPFLLTSVSKGEDEFIVDAAARTLDFYVSELGSPVQRKIKFLQLIAPDDFQTKAPWPSFASGFNVLNGIAVCSPQSPSYLRETFGIREYKDFVVQAVVHEFGHFWTSAGEAKTKSIIYSHDDCPQFDRMMIGEFLNGYFTMPIQAKLFNLPKDDFWEVSIMSRLNRALKRRKADGWINLFLVDVLLQTSYRRRLWDIYKNLIQVARSDMFCGFRNMNFLTDQILTDCPDANPVELQRLLMINRPQDYVEELRKSFVLLGSSCELIDGEVLLSKPYPAFYPIDVSGG